MPSIKESLTAKKTNIDQREFNSKTKHRPKRV